MRTNFSSGKRNPANKLSFYEFHFSTLTTLKAQKPLDNYTFKLLAMCNKLREMSSLQKKDVHEKIKI